MLKETSHRADELEALGWSKDDVLRYAELWDYRQRWGAINLEREDRQFLRKAESALPKLVVGKAPVRKSIQEKSYYRWLVFYLEAMLKAENCYEIDPGDRGVWAILLEEELRVIAYYEPVLGLPDTIKAKALDCFREEFVKKTEKLLAENCESFTFDFFKPLEEFKATQKSSWRTLREQDHSSKNNYPVIKAKAVKGLRDQLRSELVPLICELLPSLSDTDKPEIPDEWNLESK